MCTISHRTVRVKFTMREIFKRMHVPSSPPLYFLWISIYLVAAFAAGISNSVFPSQRQKQQQRGTNERGFFACDVCLYKREENLTIRDAKREENRATRRTTRWWVFRVRKFRVDVLHRSGKWRAQMAGTREQLTVASCVHY